MPAARFLRLSIVTLSLLFTGTSFAPSARAECKLYDDLVRAMEQQKTLEKAAADAKLSPATIGKLEAALGPFFMDHFQDDPFEVNGDFMSFAAGLDENEKKELKAWLEARETRIAADNVVAKAQQAFGEEWAKAEAAVKEAEAAYAKEVEFLTAEKAALKEMGHDDPAYLDRVSKLLERLKAAYTKLNADLAPFAGCSGSARTFITDKETRLMKIAALEAEIARRRAGGGAAGAAVVAKPADPEAPGPLGDTWVRGEPEIGKFGGAITAADATGITIEVDQGDGTKKRSRIDLKAIPPATIRINERLDLVAAGSGDVEAYICGGFWYDNVMGKWISGSNGVSNHADFKRGSDPNGTNADIHFYFTVAHEPATILFYGGRFNGEEVKIVWTYKRAGG